LNLLDPVDPFPFIFQFAPLVESAKEGKRDIIGDFKVPDVFNVEKSTNTVGEASTWNRLIFDVDESTVLVEGNFNVESTLKNIPCLHRYFST